MLAQVLVLYVITNSVQCLQTTPDSSESIRLHGGPDAYEGRLEVWSNNQWASICWEDWDLQDAGIACVQLGFQGASEAVPSDSYGNGNNSLWLTNVECMGSEDRVQACNFSESNLSCIHAAGVICSSEISVRLVDGEGDFSGRLEVLFRGQWGTVCQDAWDQMDAQVVCQMLGAPGVQSAMTFFGPGNGPIWLDNVECDGVEENIGDCRFPGWGKHDCSHQHDVGLSCQGVRLVGGSSSKEGRVEIYHKGSWGSVCDNQWDLEDADVVCKQLGFPSAFKATGAAAFGEGVGPILLDDVQCSGEEVGLKDCYNRGWGQHVCQHSQDAGVICDEVRLIGGIGDFEGRLEILHDGHWGTVCNDAWDFEDARVVCQQLGYEDVNQANTGVTRFGEGTGEIWLDEVACEGDERRLVDCGRPVWGENDCNHSEDVGIICETGPTLRLERGSQASGRVEILYEGVWGTVCDYQWDIADAVVVCRYLGYPGASWATPGGSYGEGSGPVWMSDVQCTGAEGRLHECSQDQDWGVSECPHTHDAGVVCVPEIPDTDPPVISDCPTDIFTTVNDRSSDEVLVAWRQPIASDNSKEIPSVVITHSPDSLFPIGVTTVTYTFEDSAQNSAVCSFDVIVEALPTTTSQVTTKQTTEFFSTGQTISQTTNDTSTPVRTSTKSPNTIQLNLTIYLALPMVLSISLVFLIAALVHILYYRKSGKRGKSSTKTLPENRVYLSAETPSPAALTFEPIEPPPTIRSSTMEGRRLPSEPELCAPVPCEADFHDYTDADSGHYEAVKDENGYLVLYDEPPKDTEGYLMPSNRLSATQENLVVYSERPESPPITFENDGYERTLVRNSLFVESTQDNCKHEPLRRTLTA